jgi:hypothetical protein
MSKVSWHYILRLGTAAKHRSVNFLLPAHPHSNGIAHRRIALLKGFQGRLCTQGLLRAEISTDLGPLDQNPLNNNQENAMSFAKSLLASLLYPNLPPDSFNLNTAFHYLEAQLTNYLAEKKAA